MSYSDADYEDAMKVISHLCDLYDEDDEASKLFDRIQALAKGANLTSEEYEMLHPDEKDDDEDED